MKARRTPILLDVPLNASVRLKKHAARSDRLTEFRLLLAEEPRWKRLRTRRRALAAERRMLRKNRLPTRGGDCRRVGGATSERDNAVAHGMYLIERRGRRSVRCGICGEPALFMEHPCPRMSDPKLKCSDVPF